MSIATAPSAQNPAASASAQDRMLARLTALLMPIAYLLGKPLDIVIRAVSFATTYGIRGGVKANFAQNPVDRTASMHVQLGQATDLIGVTVAIIAVGVIVFLGITIMSDTRKQTNLSSGDAFYQAQQDFTTTMGDMFGYIGLAMLAAMASVILGYLVAFRGTAR